MSDNKQQPSVIARYRQLAPSASLMVSPMCLGTMTFGEAHSETYGKCDKETSFKILDTYVGLGGNFLDTANV
jgi:aryl-alcohol dehydrogenase-like predicted oxidoreductase